MVAEMVICHNVIPIKSSFDKTKLRITLFRYTEGSYLTVIRNN